MLALQRRRYCVLIVVVILLAIGWSGAAGAQRPEQKQEVQVPGTDLWLKRGWQVFVYQGCRFAVPVSWRAEADGSLATAPDGSNVSVRAFSITSWSEHKARIKSAFGRINLLLEDSDHRLWLQIGDRPRIQHYVDVLNGSTVCSALLEIRSSAAPDAENTFKRIAESVGPAPETWPPDRR